MSRNDLNDSERIYVATLKIRAALNDLYDVITTPEALGGNSPTILRAYEEITETLDALNRANGTYV